MTAVRVETDAGVMRVTLADVENRNALGAALLQGLHDAIETANADPTVRAVVITTEGTTFCAGANLKERSGAKRIVYGLIYGMGSRALAVQLNITVVLLLLNPTITVITRC